jgi:hypothetical protein
VIETTNNQIGGNMTDHNKIIENLESMVDSEGLSGIIGDLAEICYLKAEHISSNWQDEVSAKTWINAARILHTAEARVDL